MAHVDASCYCGRLANITKCSSERKKSPGRDSKQVSLYDLNTPRKQRREEAQKNSGE
jgi:hypothetical protein